MSDNMIQRKFLQTGEKQEKFLMKPLKNKGTEITAKNAKHKAKQHNLRNMKAEALIGEWNATALKTTFESNV